MKRISPYFWPAVFVLGAVVGAIVTCVVRFLTGPGKAIPTLQMGAVSIAGLAFAVAILTFCFNWRKSKTDLFISMHEKLIDPAVQNGRKVISDKVKGIGTIHHLTTTEFESANRALALYDTLAMYARRRYIIKRDFIGTWGLAMHRRAPQIRAFIAYRASMDGYMSWKHLSSMLDVLDKNPPKDN
ncbi:hypothetical protein GCM10023346_00370 [Arthrobacter gyeryongensis]|uniref:DUF4760 domain-containing protein n=1 Tax=Arthrobacter gyeryongensis TaxID=1650592 RepID=A0ABP9RXR0_9MICC